MKKIICITVACLAFFTLYAQTPVQEADTLAPATAFWEEMPQSIRVNQSQGTVQGFENYRLDNYRKGYNGFRVRIFYSNSQNARRNAAVAIDNFCLKFPGTQYYFEYDNPFFLVTVGDYGSRIAAERALRQFKTEFSSAVIVKQKLRFPTER